MVPQADWRSKHAVQASCASSSLIPALGSVAREEARHSHQCDFLSLPLSESFKTTQTGIQSAGLAQQSLAAPIWMPERSKMVKHSPHQPLSRQTFRDRPRSGPKRSEINGLIDQTHKHCSRFQTQLVLPDTPHPVYSCYSCPHPWTDGTHPHAMLVISYCYIHHHLSCYSTGWYKN